ncbi:hypothetical protein [Streptomyces sp. NPDC057702]|uniref:hypothetical protein n=1 Tax=unclassified Streptomyces TaxID=2593676 RepID=UPI0036B66091
MNDRLLGAGLPVAGDVAAGGLVLAAALLAGVLWWRARPPKLSARGMPPAPRLSERSAASRSRRRRRAGYVVPGALAATAVSPVLVAAGQVRVDQLTRRAVDSAFDWTEGPAGVPAELRPAAHHRPGGGADRIRPGLDARAHRVVPLSGEGLTVLCTPTRRDPRSFVTHGTRLSVVDLDTGRAHWSVSANRDLGRHIVVDSEHDAIGPLTGAAAVRFHLTTGKTAAVHALPPIRTGWSLVPARPDTGATPTRAPGHLLMSGEPVDADGSFGYRAAAALDLTTGWLCQLARASAWRCDFVRLTARAGARAAPLTTDRNAQRGGADLGVTALDRTGARITTGKTVPLGDYTLPVPGQACALRHPRGAVLGLDGTVIVLRTRGRLGHGEQDLVAVDTAAGRMRWRRVYGVADIETFIGPTRADRVEHGLLARTTEGGHGLVDRDTGEVRERWTGDDTRRSPLYAADGYGSLPDAVTYGVAPGDGGAIPWRPRRLDPRTLRPTGAPLFEITDFSPVLMTTGGGHVFGWSDGQVTALRPAPP